MDIAILLGLIVLNGVFAMSEIALVTAKKSRLNKLAEDGDAQSKIALSLSEDPTRLLSSIQIGITSISILNGIVGEQAFAPPLAAWLMQTFAMPEKIAAYAATAFVVVIITYLSIVLGELVPKRIGQMNAEPIARTMARPMRLLAKLTKPFVWLLAASTNILLGLLQKLFGIQPHDEPDEIEEEIHALIEEGSEAGVIEDQERQMLRNVFRLDDRQITSLMVPRADIAFLDVNASLEDNLRVVADSPHSRFPVCSGGLQNVLGIASTKLILSKTLRGQTPDFNTDLVQPLFVPETLTGMELLEQFKASSVHMAFVMDEYGEVQGLVTQQDVLEAITGEFKPQTPEDAWSTQREDGSWLLDGSIPIPELKDILGLKTVPEEDRAQYQTLAGMIMLLLAKLPHTGEHVDWQAWRFEVIDLDGKRIDKVLASLREQNQEIESTANVTT